MLETMYADDDEYAAGTASAALGESSKRAAAATSTTMTPTATRACACKAANTCGACRPDLYANTDAVPASVAAAALGGEIITAAWCPECQQMFASLSVCKACSDHQSGPASASTAPSPSRPDHGALSKVDVPFEAWNMLPFTGLAVFPRFLSDEDEAVIVSYLDGGGPTTTATTTDKSEPLWVASQSGRHKVDFGPRANFKLRKAQPRPSFLGFPLPWKALMGRACDLTTAATHAAAITCAECRFGFLRETNNTGLAVPATAPRLANGTVDCECARFGIAASARHKSQDSPAAAPTDELQQQQQQYRPAQLVALDYEAAICSNLDPHMDDAWMWGARIVGISCLSDTVMTFVQRGRRPRTMVRDQSSAAVAHDTTATTSSTTPIPTPATTTATITAAPESSDTDEPVTVMLRVPLPRYAAFVLSGAARYHWLHGIEARDITHRRVSLTLREMTTGFALENPELAAEFARTAATFV